MSYSKFTLESVIQDFGLHEQTEKLFNNVRQFAPTEWLTKSLQKGKIMPAKSEKSRSELLIMPILLTIAEANEELITIFSGEFLDGDSSAGLSGECDFILSKSARSFSLKAPIFGIVEAKQNIIENSMGQCAAQMVGAQRFNARKGNEIPMVYGAVSNGDIWQFLSLDGIQLKIDTDKYYIDDLNQLLGVLQFIINIHSITN
jgi:hypothetical protein